MALAFRPSSEASAGSSDNERDSLQSATSSRGGAILGGRKRLFLAAFVALCLLIVFSRVSRLPTLEMDPDEVWSVWQTFGTPAQIIAWTPYDWPPLSYLLIGMWRSFAGINPFAIRLFALWFFLPGIALLYRTARRITNDTAALIAVAACAALGYVINVSLLLRGYVIIFTLAILVWWLALRYFEKPSRGRGIALTLAMIALVYTHLTGIFAIGIIFLYTLVVYRKLVWRWWPPLLITVIATLPILFARQGAATSYTAQGLPIFQQWIASGGTIFWQNVGLLLQNFAGYSFELWSALFILASALVASRYARERKTLALIVWMLAPLPCIVAVLVGAFTNRHLLWITVGYAIWMGWGFSRLPRSAIAALLAVFAVLMISPVPIAEQYKDIHGPMVETYSFLASRTQQGDVVVIDPSVVRVSAEEWDYFTQAYFPTGLTYVSNPGDARRAWYFAADGKEKLDLEQAVQHDRAPGDSISAMGYTLRLYEAPPDVTGTAFENGLRFQGMDALDQSGPILVRRSGDTLHVRLWWSVDKPMTLDYSVGVYVLDNGKLVAQSDGAPQPAAASQQTSQWTPGRYYVEDRTIQLPPISSGDYALRLSVYQSWDGQRIKAPGLDSANLLNLGTLRIKAL